MGLIRSLLFYAAFYSGTAVMVTLALSLAVVAPKRMPGAARAWARWHRVCLRIVGISIRQVGERATGPVLYAFKHESFFEAIDLPGLLNQPVPFAKKELFSIPGWGRAASAYGAISVSREEGARALRSMVTQARVFTAKGRPLAIFPEGTRVPHGEQAPLRSGFTGLYKLLNLPVVPVAVDSGPLYHRFIKRPGTITLQFGNSIEPGLPREEIEARVTAAINALNQAG